MDKIFFYKKNIKRNFHQNHKKKFNEKTALNFFNRKKIFINKKIHQHNFIPKKNL